MILPNFLIIGPGKSGTTALYGILVQHPEIYMSPVKEPHFFSFDGAGDNTVVFGYGHRKIVLAECTTMVRNIEDYAKLFIGVKDEKAIGEASPSYLSNQQAPAKIYQYIPKAKLIAVFRNPINRSYSHYLHNFASTRESRDFVTALKAGHYLKEGYYSIYVKRYLKIFDQKQLGLFLYDDFRADFGSFIRQVLQFLEVDIRYVPDMKNIRTRKSGKPKNKIIHNIFKKKNLMRTLVRLMIPKQFRGPLGTKIYNRNVRRPEMYDEARNILLTTYREEILQFQDLINRDLSHWIE